MTTPTAYEDQRGTIPVGHTGLHGWTSCCAASATFDEFGTLCCKACWREVAEVRLPGQAGDQLDQIVTAVIDGAITGSEGVARQNTLPGVGPERPLVTLPGTVWNDALDPGATGMQDALGLPEPRHLRHGRGWRAVYENVPGKVVADLAEYLAERGHTMLGNSYDPGERDLYRRMVQTANRLARLAREGR